MGQNSNIEWTDHTFNPWIGCTKVSPGCANCYAERQDKFRSWTPAGWGNGKPRTRTSAANWKQPLKWNRAAERDRHTAIEVRPGEYLAFEIRRHRVFCASLADWLDDEVPIEWLADLLALIYETPNLDWLLLTKRPQKWSQRMLETIFQIEDNKYEAENRLYQWLRDWVDSLKAPHNIWLGVSVENQKCATERIFELIKIPARVEFLSCEPLLGRVDLDETGLWNDNPYGLGTVKWVICGGESGPKRRPFDPAWARSLRDQCRTAGVPFFFKQMDKVQPIPDDLLIREFPCP